MLERQVNQETVEPRTEILRPGETLIEITGFTAGLAFAEITGGRAGVRLEELLEKLGDIGYRGVSLLPNRPITHIIEDPARAERLIGEVAAIGRSWNADRVPPRDMDTEAKYLITALPPNRLVRPIDYFMFPPSSTESAALQKMLDLLESSKNSWFYQTHNVAEAMKMAERLRTSHPNAHVALELKPDNYTEIMQLINSGVLRGNLPLSLALDTRHAREALENLRDTVSYRGKPTKLSYNDPYLAVLETIFSATSLIHFQGMRGGMIKWFIDDKSELWRTVNGDNTELSRFSEALREVSGNSGIQLPICVEHHFTIRGQVESGAKDAIAQAGAILRWVEGNLR